MADSSLWILNSDTCSPPKQINNIKQCIGFNVNKARCLKPGARKFSDFKSDDIGQTYEICFQLFIKTCEKVRDQLWTLTHQKGLDTHKSPIGFFLESIRSADGKEITDYTFWAFIYDYGSESSSLNFNTTFEELINAEISQGHKSADRSANFTSRARAYIDPEEHKQHHRWKLAKGQSILPAYFDMLLGLNIAMEQSDYLRTFRLGTEQSLVAATNLFSNLSAVAGRGTQATNQSDIHQAHRIANFRTYFGFSTRDDYDDGGFDSDSEAEDELIGMREMEEAFNETPPDSTSEWSVFTFPNRKYAHRIHVGEMTVENIINKYLPDVNEMILLGTYSKIPLLIKRFHDTFGEKFNFSLEQLDNDVLEYIDSQRSGVPATESTEVPPEIQFRRDLAAFAANYGWAHLLTAGRQTSADEICLDQTETFNRNFLRSSSGFVLRSGEDLHIAGGAGFISDFAEVRAETTQLFDAIEELGERLSTSGGFLCVDTVMRNLYLMARDFGFRQYCNRCRSKESNVSIHEAACIRAFTEGGMYKPGKYYLPKSAQDITPFCSSEIVEYINNSLVFLTARLHRELSLCSKYALDAYRLELDDIHLNIIMMSYKGATGKSWALKTMQKRMCDGTTEDVAHQSTQAGMDERRNQNGIIQIIEEFDPSLVATRNAQDTSNRSGIFRGVLTSGKKTASRFTIAKDGRKYTEKIDVECTGVIEAACNWSKVCRTLIVTPPFIGHYGSCCAIPVSHCRCRGSNRNR